MRKHVILEVSEKEVQEQYESMAVDLKGRCYDIEGNLRTILKMTECELHEPKEEEQ